MSDCDCHIEAKDKPQKQTLINLLLINAAMFVVELSLGWYAQSTGLIADSLDMLADATVYGIGLYAVGRSVTRKAQAALTSGWLQLALGLLIIIDAIRRTIVGSEPVSALMIGVGIAALIANIICLRLIEKHRQGEVHMRASWIFSRNDVIANAGVIFSGLLVWLLNARWPDLLIGTLIAAVILKGAQHIIRDARRELSAAASCCSSASSCK